MSGTEQGSGKGSEGNGYKESMSLEDRLRVLSRKLNDAISGRVFYADFGTPQGNQSL